MTLPSHVGHHRIDTTRSRPWCRLPPLQRFGGEYPEPTPSLPSTPRRLAGLVRLPTKHGALRIIYHISNAADPGVILDRVEFTKRREPLDLDSARVLTRL